MENSYCRYCLEELKSTDEQNVLTFSEDCCFHFHKQCYEEYKEKCNLMKVVLRHLNDNSYQNCLKEMESSFLSIPNQNEENCICKICFNAPANTLLLPCRHRICADCLLSWRGQTVRSSRAGTRCCFCRSLITKTIVQQTE